MTQNSCYTYFAIKGIFDPDVITETLGLLPDISWKHGDKRANGTTYDFSLWQFGRCDNYDVLTENQMHTTIEPLLDKIKLLNKIKSEFDVDFTLQIVPTIYPDNTKPCLAPSLKVIDFCYATRTKIDIDMYVIEKE